MYPFFRETVLQVSYIIVPSREGRKEENNENRGGATADRGKLPQRSSTGVCGC